MRVVYRQEICSQNVFDLGLQLGVGDAGGIARVGAATRRLRRVARRVTVGDIDFGSGVLEVVDELFSRSEVLVVLGGDAEHVACAGAGRGDIRQVPIDDAFV